MDTCIHTNVFLLKIAFEMIETRTRLKLLEQLQEAKRRVTPIIQQRTLPAERKAIEIRRVARHLRGLIRKMEIGTVRVPDFIRFNTKRQYLKTLYSEQASRKWDELVAKAETALNPEPFWRQIRKMITKKPLPLTIQDENGRTLETENQLA